MCEKRLTPEEELQQYRAIGTVNECQEAKEKQTAKKPVDRRELQNFNLQVYAYRGGGLPIMWDRRTHIHKWKVLS